MYENPSTIKTYCPGVIEKACSLKTIYCKKTSTRTSETIFRGTFGMCAKCLDSQWEPYKVTYICSEHGEFKVSLCEKCYMTETWECTHKDKVCSICNGAGPTHQVPCSHPNGGHLHDD